MNGDGRVEFLSIKTDQATADFINSDIISMSSRLLQRGLLFSNGLLPS